MQVDEKTWAAVRRAYADPSVPLKDIAERYGPTPLAIGARAKREDWPGREERTRPKTGTKARKAASRPAPKRRSARAEAGEGLPTRKAQAAVVGRQAGSPTR